MFTLSYEDQVNTVLWGQLITVLWGQLITVLWGQIITALRGQLITVLWRQIITVLRGQLITVLWGPGQLVSCPHKTVCGGQLITHYFGKIGSSGLSSQDRDYVDHIRLWFKCPPKTVIFRD